MFLIVAGERDEAARALASRGRDRGAVLVTARDLSTAGWRDAVGGHEPGAAVVQGRIVCARDVAGVLTRLAAVDGRELRHIVPADRDYVAQEMTAFLASWLSRLSCPILNRPTPACLSGPSWRRERWIHEAARLRIPVRAVHRSVTLGGAGGGRVGERGPVTITIVGDRWFGQAEEALAHAARRLATAAGVDLAAVHFSGARRGARLVGADVWPDVGAPDIGEAIFAYLAGPRPS
jgi:hypothetical protein